MPHEMRRGPWLVIGDGPAPHTLEPPPRSSPAPRPSLDPIAEQLAVWDSWATEHRYPEGLRAAVALAIRDGALWRAGSQGGHRVRVEGPDAGDVRMRLGGLCWDGACWVWCPEK